jgi:homoserine kinase
MTDQPLSRAFTVRVPATTANLGAGFDCLGLALELYNSILVEPAQALEIHITGEGAGTLPLDGNNRIVKAMQRACAALRRPVPSVRLHMQNSIPLARGLGSSASVNVAGLMIANHIYGTRLSPSDLLYLANQLEGHPDNVAPALLGGMVVAAVDEGKPHAVKIPWPEVLRCVIYAPDASLSTAKARAVLPPTVSRADAIFNAGRAALWVAALTQGRYDLLRLATQDHLHQPYRKALIAGFDSILSSALTAGAYGAFLSGAGSSLAAIADGSAEAVAAAMQSAAKTAGHRGRVFILAANRDGAMLESA